MRRGCGDRGRSWRGWDNENYVARPCSLLAGDRGRELLLKQAWHAPVQAPPHLRSGHEERRGCGCAVGWCDAADIGLLSSHLCGADRRSVETCTNQVSKLQLFGTLLCCRGEEKQARNYCDDGRPPGWPSMGGWAATTTQQHPAAPLPTTTTTASTRPCPSRSLPHPRAAPPC